MLTDDWHDKGLGRGINHSLAVRFYSYEWLILDQIPMQLKPRGKGGGQRSNRKGIKNENEMENQRYLMRDGIYRGYIAQGADPPPPFR
jgi:hypothetical protein